MNPSHERKVLERTRKVRATAARMRFTVFALALAVAAASCGPPAAPITTPKPTPTVVAKDPNDAPLPLDTRVKKGKLANGLTYYVMAHKKPEGRAQIWLAVNAGAVLEDDDQRGLAHFVEHMGFNGTTRF